MQSPPPRTLSPHISTKFNTAYHDERKLALDLQEQQQHTETIRIRREQLRDTERRKVLAKVEGEQKGRQDHRKNMRGFRAARGYEQHLEECVKRRQADKA
eukprot:gene36884-24033_t